jgi:hypothetical protein
MTCKLKVEFINLEEGQQSGYVHSKTYPYLRKESWYMIITESSMTGLAFVEKVPIQKRIYEKEFMEKVSNSGKIEFVVILANDSYKGLDQIVTCSIDINAPDPLRKDYVYLPEDMALMKEQKEEDEKEDTDAEDSDTEKPSFELDHEELMRRLKRKGLDQKAKDFEVQFEKDKKVKKRKITEKNFDDERETNPFIPELIKTLQQRKEEKEKTKKDAEDNVKIKDTDKKILGEARPPMEDETYLRLMCITTPLIWDHLVMTPVSGWSTENAYFDGIKYCGPLMQNPCNPLNMEQDDFLTWKDDIISGKRRTKKLDEDSNWKCVTAEEMKEPANDGPASPDEEKKEDDQEKPKETI